jgi:hypothetical protein
MSFREIDAASLEANEDGSAVRWFTGERGAELFLWVRGTQAPHHAQLLFQQRALEWDANTGLLRTGGFQTKVAKSGGRFDPYLLQLGGGAESAVAREALELLEGSGLSPELWAGLKTALEAAIARQG